MKPQHWMECQDAQSWTEWLLTHHQDAKEIWLRLRKKQSTLHAMNREDAVAVALCYGWIDSQLSTLDDESYLLHFTPRRSSSVWSLRNRLKAEELMQKGLMQEAGYKAIDSARLSGAWDTAYSSRNQMPLPVELLEAFAQNALAQSDFMAWSISDRNQAIFWINQAKKLDTKQKRIQRLMDLLNARLPLNQLD